MTIVVEASDGGAKRTVTGERQDGTAINTTSTVKYDGKEYPVTGATWDTVSVRQIDANTFTVEQKKTGAALITSADSVFPLVRSLPAASQVPFDFGSYLPSKRPHLSLASRRPKTGRISPSSLPYRSRMISLVCCCDD
jgi:Tol biopolymer transport system component